MRDTVIVAVRTGLAAVVFAAVLGSACSGEARNEPSGEAGTDGRGPASEGSRIAPEDSTTERADGVARTGVITEARNYCQPSKGECSRIILVEEEPDADCSGRREPLASGCEKTYFDVTGKTEVFRKVGDSQKSASVADLHEGLRVSADYMGYAVMESYPTQTGARAVTILKSPLPHDEKPPG